MNWVTQFRDWEIIVGVADSEFPIHPVNSCLPMPGVNLARLEQAEAVDNIYAPNTSIAL